MDTNNTMTGAAALVRTAIAVVVMSCLGVALTISFVSFIYSGALADHLSKGIGLAMLGLALMAVVAGALSRFAGTICHSQDAPALLLATATVSIVAGLGADGDGPLAFATVATFIAVASLLTGVSLWAAGKYRLGALARFIPYSVVAGFLAATGVLLTLGGLGMIAKQEISVWHLNVLYQPDVLFKILPWLAYSLLVTMLTRLFPGETTIPAMLLVGVVVFYVILALLGMSLTEASDKGYLLGPFDGSNFLAGIDPGFVLEARWDLILAQAPSLVAVVAIAMLGLLLNVSGLEIAEKESVNFEAELKAAGAANLAGGAVGGMIGYHMLAETLMARRMGLRNVLGAVALSATAVAVVLGGANIVALAPAGLFASVIMILGLDLVYEWLWVQRKRLPRNDVVVMLLIVLTAVTVGFLEALLVGLIAAVVFFALSYAKIDVVRLQSDGASRRSSVERPRNEMATLSQLGAAWRIYDLRDFVFFGSANSLFERMKAELEGPNPPQRFILNFAGVSGTDTSALFAFTRIQDLCARHGARLIFAALPNTVADQVARIDGLQGTQIYKSLDSALADIETQFLDAHSEPVDEHDETLLVRLKHAHPDVDFDLFTKRLTLKAGDVLVTEGQMSTEVFQVDTGGLIAELELADGSTANLATFLPGAVMGEIPAFANVARTATIRASVPSTVTSISIEAIPQTPQGRSLQADLSRQMAGYLARRLIRMTNLFRDMRL